MTSIQLVDHLPARTDLPSGTVTFLFTDVEGSTKLLHELGAEGYAQVLADHRGVLRKAFMRHGGVEVDTQGDAFFVAFTTAPGALAAVEEMREGLAETPIRVRMGLHTGTPYLAEEGYVGPDVNRAARIAACGHGGQVLVSTSTAALVGVDGLRDLGEHRLKDLSAPERIYQLGEGEFPPLTSLHQTNLPIPATPFLGRERELADVSALLAREDVRLLTLTGPGGTGKTRLALQAAGLAADAFQAGVWWVPLAPLRDPELVLETAGQALGAKDGLAEHIADKRLLLLLDNFEQVVDAAGDLAKLLAACPKLQVLVTSRELLQLPGEQAYPVPPLEPEEGSELFLARARAVKPGFLADGAVAELCERLDQLPLALELAAARVRMLSPAQLLERLSSRLDLLKGGRGVDARQQTLRATIEWSHDLLPTDEQQLFSRLSVFSGGCTLEAAEAVCDADLDLLQSLVDKSLLRVREGERFWMLETIREYAAERLQASGEAEELQRRHAEHFLALAEEAEPHLIGGSPEWHDRLEREHDNLRTSFDWFIASANRDSALGLAGALTRFWSQRGHHAEGRRRLERALETEALRTPRRANALNGAALLAIATRDPATARARAQAALEIYRALGDARGTARSIYFLGLAARDEGDFVTAKQLFEESSRALLELGDEHAGVATSNLAWMCSEVGEPERAQTLYEENLGRARAAGDRAMEAVSLEGLAGYAREAGRVDDALLMVQEALRIYRHLGDVMKTGDSLGRVAKVHVAAGRFSIAAQLVAASDRLYEEASISIPFWVAETNEETREAIRAHLDDAAFAEAREQGGALTVDEAVALALGDAY